MKLHRDVAPPVETTRPDRAARAALMAVFAANGAISASWIVRIPDVKAGLEMSEATLGVVLLVLAVGIVAVLPFAGGCVERIGSRWLCLIGAAIGSAGLAGIPSAGSPITLSWWLLLAGAGSSLMDVSMNAQGLQVERGYRRSLMVGFHGAWSLGTAAAALGGAILLGRGIATGPHLRTAACVTLATVLLALPWLRANDRGSQVVGRLRARTRVLALPNGPLLPVAAVALGAVLAENTTSDWSGVYLASVVAVEPGRVAWGYVAFTATMAITRCFGDRVADRIGAHVTMLWGGRIAAIGFAVLAFVPVLPVALLGFVAIGVGVSVILPLAFATAAGIARSPGEGVAAVATVGYIGFAIGPPGIGAIAEVAGLRWALVTIGVAIWQLSRRACPRGELGQPGVPRCPVIQARWTAVRHVAAGRHARVRSGARH